MMMMMNNNNLQINNITLQFSPSHTHTLRATHHITSMCPSHIPTPPLSAVTQTNTHAHTHTRTHKVTWHVSLISKIRHMDGMDYVSRSSGCSTSSASPTNREANSSSCSLLLSAVCKEDEESLEAEAFPTAPPNASDPPWWSFEGSCPLFASSLCKFAFLIFLNCWAHQMDVCVCERE